MHTLKGLKRAHARTQTSRDTRTRKRTHMNLSMRIRENMYKIFINVYLCVFVNIHVQ